MSNAVMDLPAAHRPWPLPDSPWIMFQEWQDLLFAHWPIEPDELRRHVPRALLLDTFKGQAWLGITPFRVTGARPRLMPAVPGISDFPELNVRTYVTVEDKPGVYFFSLDADNALAVDAARAAYKLPYYKATMCAEQDGPYIRYSTRRTHPGAPEAEFKGRYRPIGDPFNAEQGTLEYFLAERYCLYTLDDESRIYRAEIHHGPWPLQAAEAGFEVNTMAGAAGISLPDSPPLLHFARIQPTVIWPLEPISV